MQQLESELTEVSQLIFATNYDERSAIQAKAAALKAVFYLIKDHRKSNFSNFSNFNSASSESQTNTTHVNFCLKYFQSIFAK